MEREAPKKLTALVRVGPAFSTASTVFVTRLQTEFCRPQTSRFRLLLCRCEAAALFSGNLAVICRGNRRGILGRGARLRVRRHLRDLLPVPRVLQFPNPQLRGADR